MGVNGSGEQPSFKAGGGTLGLEGTHACTACCAFMASSPMNGVLGKGDELISLRVMESPVRALQRAG
jgi:hypothetical protein